MSGKAALAACAVVALALAGCGSTSSQRAVSLTVSAPTNGAEIAVSRVRVFGTVTPSGASVLVGNSPAQVSNGTFTRWITVGRGVSYIRIAASAGGYRPARVTIGLYSSLCATKVGGAAASCARSRQRSTEGTPSA
jgi:hypothetical protein